MPSQRWLHVRHDMRKQSTRQKSEGTVSSPQTPPPNPSSITSIVIKPNLKDPPCTPLASPKCAYLSTLTLAQGKQGSTPFGVASGVHGNNNNNKTESECREQCENDEASQTQLNEKKGPRPPLEPAWASTCMVHIVRNTRSQGA